MSITTDRTGQKYLVLMALPDGSPMPMGETAATIAAQLDEKLVTGRVNAGDFWATASYGKCSFDFTIEPAVVALPKALPEYYLAAEAKKIVGAEVTYPVTWAGGETLTLRLDDGTGASETTITFPAGDMDFFSVRMAIRAQVDLDFPFVAPITVDRDGDRLVLETVLEGDEAVLNIVGGTAVDTLGLGVGSTTTDPVELVDEDGVLRVDAATTWVNGRNVGTTLGAYDGLIVVVLVSEAEYRASAAIEATELNINGTNVELSPVNCSFENSWKVFAHEIGHNLGFPDLYDEPGPPEWLGEEIGNWDIMAGGGIDVHPSVWIKHRKTGNDPMTMWIPDSHVASLNPGTSVEVILIPYFAQWPATNPYLTDHPGVPLARVLRVPIGGDGRRALYLENRQRYSFAPPFGDNPYSTDLPEDGVVVFDGHDDVEGLIVYRSNVIKGEATFGPLATFVDHRVLEFPNGSGVEVSVERIGYGPDVYKVNAEWKPAPFTDVYIRPWEPPPYESVDMWVDTLVDNNWNEYSQSDPALNPDIAGNPVLNGDRMHPGMPARVYARFWNRGNVDAENVDVTFAVAVPAGIGPTPETELDPDQIDIPAGGSAVAAALFNPRTDNDGHVCIRVTAAGTPGDLNLLDNSAQENFTHWYPGSGSPYEPVSFPVAIANPLPRRAHIWLQGRGLVPGLTMDVDWRVAWLNRGETRTVNVELGVADWFPNELQYDDIGSPPVATLEASVFRGDAWAPFGGISGMVHTVYRTEVQYDCEETNDGMVLHGLADSSGGPVPGASVSAFFWAGEDVVDVRRERTTSAGQFELLLPRVLIDASDTTRLFLSPQPGYGPWSSETQPCEDLLRVDRGK